mmetsp:Transcript_22738/g.61620  ORF Transcript_22738/g.61620 Transcript_22738/m.61620 type:complete len:201 (+) Transcript_22738:66-668(+)
MTQTVELDGRETEVEDGPAYTDTRVFCGIRAAPSSAKATSSRIIPMGRRSRTRITSQSTLPTTFPRVSSQPRASSPRAVRNLVATTRSLTAAVRHSGARRVSERSILSATCYTTAFNDPAAAAVTHRKACLRRPADRDPHPPHRQRSGLGMSPGVARAPVTRPCSATAARTPLYLELDHSAHHTTSREHNVAPCYTLYSR